MKAYYTVETAAEFTATNPILFKDGIAEETDTHKRKIGDGKTRWNDLEYYFDPTVVSSGGSLDHQAHVQLTDDDIKALPSTPFQTVAAPGANKVLVFEQAIFSSNFTGAAYTNIPNSVFCDFVIDPDTWYIQVSDQNPSTWSPFFKNTDATQQLMHAGISALPLWRIATANAVNKPLVFAVENGTGDFTGGDPANTLDIYVKYSILNLTSGLFE